MRKNVFLNALLIIIFGTTLSINGQKIAVIAPDGSDLDRAVVAGFVSSMPAGLKVLDSDMVWAAYLAVRPAQPFNMSAEEAQRVGSAIGCDYFVLFRSDKRSRISVNGPDQIEFFSAMYVVDAGTGLLASWNVVSYRGTDDDSKGLLFTIPSQAKYAAYMIKNGEGSVSEAPADIQIVPDPDSPAAKGFRPPVPYRRLKPEYTRTAYLYDITATVEATVDLDESGKITRLAITRWAGYELDESVVKTIRSMNWRPAERSGKPLPIRFLLRYNFKKIDKDDPDNE